MQHQLILHNDVQEVPLLASFIDGLAEEWGIDFSVAMSLNLAMEEAVVNVMNYAYPKGTQGEIRIDADYDTDVLTFTLIDSGTPFDPTAQAAPDTALDFDERPIGGLGIFLVRQIMDSIAYRYEKGQNILTLKKKIQTINL